MKRLERIIVAAAMFFAGCAPQVQKPITDCPDWDSVIQILKGRSQNAAPLKANGRCHLQYYADAEKHGENFPVKLWINPPDEIYLQGDVAFDPKGFVLGSNKEEFWLAIRLKEIDSYWWGRWDEQSDEPAKLAVNAKNILEALGMAEIKDEENWSLSSEDPFVVLAKKNRENVITERIYISGCDFLISRIEYLSADGRPSAVVELGGYEKKSEGFFVPTVIKIVTQPGNKVKGSVTLNLETIKTVNLTGEQQQALFTRPEPAGFKHVYRIGGN